MIIIGFGADDFINKLKKLIEQLGNELSEIGTAVSAITIQSRRELVRYKILGYKTKPPEGQLLNEKPRIVLHKSFLVLGKDLQDDTARMFKELREELENVIFFVESRKSDFKDHLFILIGRGASVFSVYIVSPETPNFNTVVEELKKAGGER
ncbi:hypothetical protein IPA_09620 [Ignicoccus pacificus DSM 13166]|uniref:Uncharacterized protein n=1 Tax=Ignicoccus pacificus DSM 13166 TaxID=940294 RepID=A0A977PKJ2_9CREN|nr:hypothetical protein IPA_09620 [Ignicoccus pacificus DSM 13166]